MLPSGVRRRLALLATLLASRTAHADDPQDPHDLFGLGKQPTSEAAPACDQPHTFGCAFDTDPLDDASPYGLSTWLSASYLLRLPVAYARHDVLAGYALGASRDEAGLVFRGATGLENRWMIEGAPADSIRTGAADTRVPVTFLDGIFVMAGGFTAHDRTSTGGTINAWLKRGTADHQLEAYVWAGLSATGRARPVAAGSYAVRRLGVDAGPEASASIVATGPLGTLFGGSAWYAAGVAPAVAATDFNWRAARLVDVDGDGNPDGLPGTLVTSTLLNTETRTLDWSVPVMARVGLDRGPHHIDLTLVGAATHGTRFLANATMQAGGVDRLDIIGDGIATWRGEWPTTRARVQLSWHRSDHRESAHDPAAANIPQLLSAYIPATLADDPELAARCHDDTYPLILQCPVPFGYFASSGAGQLVDLVGDRPTATADIAHQIGNNVVRAGGTIEDARLVTTSRFTGNEQLRSLFDGHLDHLRYVDGQCGDLPGSPFDYATGSELTYRTRYAAAYVEDTFSPQDNIRIDGGLRWELMWVGTRLHFSDELAPRLGMSWDVLGGGRSRLWVSMGRSHALLPAGIGATVIRRDSTVHDAANPLGVSRDTDAGSAFRVVPGIEPMTQDEVTAGFEVGLSQTVQLTFWAQGAWLRRGLETTTDGFDNPGRSGGLPATRETEEIAAEIATAPTGQLTLRVGYIAGRTVGTFAGPFDPRQGAALYNGDAYDAAFSTTNESGRLPTDIGHRLFVEAARRGHLAGLEVAFSTRLTLASGRPRNVFADSDVGLIPLVPLGGAGRGPMLSNVNARLSATWRGFDFTLDVFDVFDRTGATNLDELYTSGLVRPIDGGGYEDLVFLKTVTGADATRRTAFGLPTAFQAPLSAVLGVHHGF
jgi:hypothetical protein